jgi:carboxyl-terminal processing protease
VIGATLRYVDDRIVVSEVVPGGAAARAGVRPGWVLESVQGCPVANRLARIPADPDARRMALAAFSAATQLLAGPAGDTVAATFLDGTGTARAARLVRDVDAGTVTKFGNLPAMSALLSWERVRHDGRTIGIIRFNIWMPVLSPLFDAAIDSLRGADAIVLDIRGNFGGVGGHVDGRCWALSGQRLHHRHHEDARPVTQLRGQSTPSGYARATGDALCRTGRVAGR